MKKRGRPKLSAKGEPSVATNVRLPESLHDLLWWESKKRELNLPGYIRQCIDRGNEWLDRRLRQTLELVSPSVIRHLEDLVEPAGHAIVFAYVVRVHEAWVEKLKRLADLYNRESAIRVALPQDVANMVPRTITHQDYSNEAIRFRNWRWDVDIARWRYEDEIKMLKERYPDITEFPIFPTLPVVCWRYTDLTINVWIPTTPEELAQLAKDRAAAEIEYAEFKKEQDAKRSANGSVH